MKASNWIDRVRTEKNLPSDYAAAAVLGLTRSAVSKYRSRESTLDENTAIKVAHALSLNPALVLADQAMERAKDAEARGAWMSILERLGGVAASILITAGMVEIPNDYNHLEEQSNADQFIHRIK